MKMILIFVTLVAKRKRSSMKKGVFDYCYYYFDGFYQCYSLYSENSFQIQLFAVPAEYFRFVGFDDEVEYESMLGKLICKMLEPTIERHRMLKKMEIYFSDR